VRCQNTTKDRKVEEDGAIRGDLKVDERVGVDDRGKEDNSKRTGHERCESGYCVNSNIE